MKNISFLEVLLSLAIGNVGMWLIYLLYGNLWGTFAFIPWAILLFTYCTKDEGVKNG